MGGGVQFPITTSFSCSNLNQSDQIIHSLNNLIHISTFLMENVHKMTWNCCSTCLNQSPLVCPSPWEYCGRNKLVNGQKNSWKSIGKDSIGSRSSLKLTLYQQRSLVKQQYPPQTNVCNSNTSTLHMKESVTNFHQPKNVIPTVTTSHSCLNLNQKWSNYS